VSLHSKNTNNTSLKQLFALRTSKSVCLTMIFTQTMLHSNNNASLKQQHFAQTTMFKQQHFAQTKQCSLLKQCFTYIKCVSSFKKYTKHSNNTSLKQPFTQTTLRSNNNSLYIHQKSICSFIKYKKHLNNSSLYIHQKSVNNNQ
jgi:hypothetical protein